MRRPRLRGGAPGAGRGSVSVTNIWVVGAGGGNGTPSGGVGGS